MSEPFRSWGHQSDFAGRIMSGNRGPLSWSEATKGRVTTNDLLVIWAGGTASSKSNDRTKANKIAFILIIMFPKNRTSVNNGPKQG
jgi:hypothetical protein